MVVDCFVLIAVAVNVVSVLLLYYFDIVYCLMVVVASRRGLRVAARGMVAAVMVVVPG